MAKWEGGILTAAGRILQAKVEAGALLKLTKMQLGDGSETKDDIEDMVELKSPRYDISITGTTADDGVCTVSGSVSTKYVETGFYARELGLFAEDPDRGEILYMLSLDTVPDFVPPYSAGIPSTAEYRMRIGVASTDNFVINIDPDGLATIRQVREEARCLQRDTYYKVGDILYDTRLRPGFFLKCIQAGISATDEIVINRLTLNDTVQDGEVIWQVCKMSVLDGDAFRKVTNGVTTGILQRPADFAEFYQGSDGSITPAPIRFSTPRFMRNADGDIIAAKVPVQADDDSDDDSDDDEPVKEVDVPVATKEDINNIISKFS